MKYFFATISQVINFQVLKCLSLPQILRKFLKNYLISHPKPKETKTYFFCELFTTGAANNLECKKLSFTKRQTKAERIKKVVEPTLRFHHDTEQVIGSVTYLKAKTAK